MEALRGFRDLDLHRGQVGARIGSEGWQDRFSLGLL